MNFKDYMVKKIEGLIKQGVRIDLRKPFEFRDIKIETGVSKNAEGSAKVKLGKTQVLIGVKLGIGAPYPDSKDKGVLITTVELSPIASEDFELGPPRIKAIELARVTDRSIRESKIIDFKKLCIEEGKNVWTIFLDIYPINDDGNLFDASVIGALAALKTAVLPKTEKIDDEIKIVYGEFTKKKIPLKENFPITLTYRKIGKEMILDPISYEEEMEDARLSLAVSFSKGKARICAAQKGGDKPLSEEDLNKVFVSVEREGKKIWEKVKKLIKS